GVVVNATANSWAERTTVACEDPCPLSGFTNRGKMALLSELWNNFGTGTMSSSFWYVALLEREVTQASWFEVTNVAGMSLRASLSASITSSCAGNMYWMESSLHRSLRAPSHPLS